MIDTEVSAERPEVLAAQRAGADEARLHQFLDEEPHAFAVCRCGWVGMGHLEHAARYIATSAAWAALAHSDEHAGRQAWERLDAAVTAYMLGEIDGAAVAQVQIEARVQMTGVRIGPSDEPTSEERP